MYKPNCGFDNVLMSFGHDEYLYRVLTNHKVRTMRLLHVNTYVSFQDCKLPPEALYMVRYHSFYPWHSKGDYAHLASDYDKNMLSQLLLFK
jgi:inositol oxygenase